jgi:Transglycosylase SLT domain
MRTSTHRNCSLAHQPVSRNGSLSIPTRLQHQRTHALFYSWGVLLSVIILAIGGLDNRAFAGATGPVVNETSGLDRLSSAVEGAESSHGADLRMWRPDLDGPQGPMQVSAAAASDVGGGDRFDNAQNRALGRAYLADMYRRYRSWPDAVAAYNWGPGHMNSWIGSGRPAEKFPPAVARYRSRVLITSGLATDGIFEPFHGVLTRLAKLRLQARQEFMARLRARRRPDEVALLYTELMRATVPAAR